LLATIFLPSLAAEIDQDFNRFALAINCVEADGKRHQVNQGDGGRAIGPLQIHQSYWKDALQANPSIGGSYADCEKWDYSVRVMRAYLTRYAPNSMAKKDWAVLARIHNGGPTGYKEKATKKYWEKVKKAM
jgi:hypothetical protein